jgi:Cu(I)/Ag(I) efflux system membrane protein CusA/SilA
MTAVATILGLMPVLLGQGDGSEVMSRLAAPMVGGMISALLLTLFLIPVIYYLWQKRLNKTIISET